MVLTAHSLVGAAVANLFPQDPALGFLLAYGSHYAIDMIPHRDYDLDGFFEVEPKTVGSLFRNAKARLNMLMIGFDFCVGAGLAIFLFVSNRQTLIVTLLGILGGVLPDFLQFLYHASKKAPWTLTQSVHNFFHTDNHMKQQSFLGTMTQITTVALVLVCYFALR